MRSQLVITYADPAALGDVQVGAERKTSRTSFDIKRAAFIVDAISTVALGSAGQNLYSVRRLNGLVTDLFYDAQILAANANTVKPFLPKGIGTGSVQLIVENVVDATANTNAATVAYTFDKPLIG